MTYRHTQTFCLALVTLLGSLLSGCVAYRVIIVTATPSATPTTEPTAIPVMPTPVPVQLWQSPDVASDFKSSLGKLTRSGQYTWGDEASAQIKLVTKQQSTDGVSVQWVWVPVVPFASTGDDVAWADFQLFWTGYAPGIPSISDKPLTLILTSDSEHYLTTLLGQPAPTVKRDVVAPDKVGSASWDSRPSLAFVPFERLTPNMKALTLDGASVFDRNLDLGKYPLVQNFTITGDPQLVDTLMHDGQVAGQTLTTNRDLSKMTILVMTGTTALSRATAYHMETEGITLPARDILPFLQDADIVHTSNEVAFAPDCPYPNPTYVDSDILFCSNDKYLDLLKAIHLNVVELTGNHVNDWGTDAFSHTLDLYDSNHINYFGGGRNDQDARKAIFIKDHGTIIVFIGCNQIGPQMAWATSSLPGAATCDDAFLSKEIPRLKTVANVVIMTVQYHEYYQYDATLDQVQFFKTLASYGADIVFGSQAHQPQGFAFAGNSFLHYGTGNLFFDQMDSTETRQMFMDKMILYDGRHISTVLFTGMNEDYMRPRLMTSDERKDFLDTIFKVSGW